MTIRYLLAKGVTSAGPFAPTPGYKWKLLYAFAQVTVVSTLTTGDVLYLYRNLKPLATNFVTERYLVLTTPLSAGNYGVDMGASPDSNVTHIQVNVYPVITDAEELLFAFTLASGDTVDYWVVLEETKA